MASHSGYATERQEMQVRMVTARPPAPAVARRRAHRAAIAYLGVLASLAASALLALAIPALIAGGLFVVTAAVVVWHCHPATKPIRARRRYYGAHRKVDGGL
jgi:hypothetical protein